MHYLWPWVNLLSHLYLYFFLATTSHMYFHWFWLKRLIYLPSTIHCQQLCCSDNFSCRRSHFRRNTAFRRTFYRRLDGNQLQLYFKSVTWKFSSFIGHNDLPCHYWGNHFVFFWINTQKRWVRNKQVKREANILSWCRGTNKLIIITNLTWKFRFNLFSLSFYRSFDSKFALIDYF